MCRALVLLVALTTSVFWVAPPGHAYTRSNSPGPTTTTSGAVTFATFDSPTDADIATITGGLACPPAGCGAGETPPTGTAYLFASGGSVTITFTGLMDYFGLVIGSADDYNLISFFRDTTLLATFSATDRPVTGFMNFTAENAGEFFNSVTLSSALCCFEVDNLAARTTCTADIAGVPPSAAAVFTNSVTVLPNPATSGDGATIMARFLPKERLCVGAAASLMGFDHFNWVSIVGRHDALSLAPDDLRDQFGALPTVPFVDPARGGYYYQCLLALGGTCPSLAGGTTPIWGPPPTSAIQDSQPWYWDEIVPPLGTGGFRGVIREIDADYRSAASALFVPIRTDRAVDFFGQPCTERTGDEIHVLTFLAGVNADGTGSALHFPGTAFAWSYRSTGSTCSAGGGEVVKTDGSVAPILGGEITFDEFVPQGAVPPPVLTLLEGLAVTVIPDTVAPTTTASVTPAPNENGWDNVGVGVTLSAVDNAAGSGVKQIAYALSGGETGSAVIGGGRASVSIAAEGITTLTYFALDNAGNEEATRTLMVKVDMTPPPVTCSVSPPRLWPPDHRLVSVRATVTVADGLSGVAGFRLDSVTSSEPDAGTGSGDARNDIQGFAVGTASTTGQLRAERSDRGPGRVYTLKFTALDQAGNSAPCTATVTVPRILASPSPSMP